MALPKDAMKRRLIVCLVMILALVAGLASTAAAEAEVDSLKVSIELSSSKLAEPREIDVSIQVTNTGDTDMPGPVTLYDPSNKQVEEFGSPTLAAGASRSWSGKWSVTQSQLDSGKLTFKLKYSLYNAAGELVNKTYNFSHPLTYTGAVTSVEINRTITPTTARKGQTVSVTYDIINTGNVDITDVSIKENASVSSKSGTIASVPAGEKGSYTFSVTMGTKDLTSQATITYKAGGKTQTEKKDAATIKYGEVKLTASLAASKKGGLPGDTVKLGVFKVEFIKVNHSIAGSCALAIHTPVGVIVHSGDFKVDYTPVDGARIDLGRFAELGQKGVLLLMCESTNVERPGYTMSERTVGETFMNLFEKADGRIIVAMFASNIHRIQLVVDAARQYGRKVCLVGRSMINVAKVAMQLGDLKIPPADLVAAEDIDDYPDSKIAIVTTGSQGEPMSGLSRMAFAEHRKLSIRSTDMVIVSATPIPGNEKSVSRVINQLVRTGANVIYEALAEVHVSGHARREEIKLIHALTKPKFFIPIHGEYRHLYHHANLAKSMGMPEENVLIPEIGDVVELDAKSMKSAGMVQSGAVLVDGLGVGDVGSVVLRDRKLLAEDGMLIVVMGVDHELGEVVTGPDIISRGFVYMREADDLMDGAREAARKAIEEYGQIDSSDWSHIKTDVRDSVQKYIYDRLKRKPMILPIIVEI